MKHVGALVLALGLLSTWSASARADLAEPAPNRGATDVTVDGTRVTAEAWAVAKGHAVDTIIVTRLVTKEGTPSTVETYERWDLDGRTKSERGDRALGKAWEKHLWALLDVTPGEKAAGDRSRARRKRGELLERVMRDLGPRGERMLDGYVVSWTVGEGRSEGGAGRSKARIAIFAYTPTAPDPATTPPKDSTPPTTPREKASKKDAQRGAAPVAPPAPRTSPVTPGGETGSRHRHLPGAPPIGRGPGAASGSVSCGVEGSADSENGVRKHARITIDLGRNRPAAPPRGPAAPPPSVTPRDR